MTRNPATNDRLPVTLLVLRLLVFGFFLMWTLEKLIDSSRAAGIYRTYYLVRPGSATVVLMGVLELALLLAFLVGYRKRLTRSILLAMMGLAAMAPGRFYLTPFEDHILLYFAAFPTLAVVFTLYSLRDRDTLWTIADRQSAQTPAPGMTREDPRVSRCLLLIRLGVFLVFLMWNMDKFFHPLQTSRIFAGFYNIGGQNALLGLRQLSYEFVYVMGVLQLALIVAFLLGVWKRFTYAVVFALHTVSTLAPWERFLQPFSSHTLLFLGSFTMLGGCFALYYLRAYDVLWVLQPGRKRIPLASATRQEANGRARAGI